VSRVICQHGPSPRPASPLHLVCRPASQLLMRQAVGRKLGSQTRSLPRACPAELAKPLCSAGDQRIIKRAASSHGVCMDLGVSMGCSMAACRHGRHVTCAMHGASGCSQGCGIKHGVGLSVEHLLVCRSGQGHGLLMLRWAWSARARCVHGVSHVPL